MSNMTTTLSIRPARKPPARKVGAIAWLRRELFSSWGNALTTLFIVALALYWLPALLDWAVFKAVFVAGNAGSEACRVSAHTSGACWAMIGEKYRVILFGRYPYAEQWRPLFSMLALVALLVVSARTTRHGRRLLLAWGLTLVGIFTLMGGGVLGLTPVETVRWGGLPLTFLLTLGGIAGAFPLAIFLALGRHSKLPAIRNLCAIYIELVRGIPLVSVLFLAAFLFPLFLPQAWPIDALLRVFAGLTLFAAAYLAEVLRGGLQAIPRGQREAAAALGLSYWQTQSQIVLPQAVRATLPAFMNNCIGIFKESSLVTVVGLYELTGALSLALAGDPDWRAFYLEGYLFIAAIYWCGCFALSRYSRRLELKLSTSASHQP